MTDPIVPPLELVRKWQQEANHNEPMFPQVAAMAAQWGADTELEACCALLEVSDDNARDFLQSARRPKPSHFQEQPVAIAELEDRVETLKHQLDTLRADHLRMANAVANQLPNRSKFFVDFMKDAS